MAAGVKTYSVLGLILTAGAITLFVKLSQYSANTNDAETTSYCPDNFTFAGTYGSNMVLQRAPARARIWGYGFVVGDTVRVSISTGAEFQTTTIQGKADRPIWSVDLDPVEAGGSYTINAVSSGCAKSLKDVTFGDVWLCSGQSNMAFPLNEINDAESELDDVVNYPNVRSFFTQLHYADSPQEDVKNTTYWTVPTKENMGSFSAVCWLFGKLLYQKYQRPIGLIQSAWGGTRIEAWSSPEALQVCYGGDVPQQPVQNAASVLYNAMIHPFLPMPIFGAIWYQGEANAMSPDFYGCSIREMVNDWRQRWFTETVTMDPHFPFGEVQLAPNARNDSSMGFPDIRWQQSLRFGYVPNDQLQRFFMAVSMDLPDFNSPRGPIHPRYKREVAERLALGAFDVAYGDSSNGSYKGPLPSGIKTNGNTIVLSYDGFTLEQRGHPDNYVGYEVCCSQETGLVCTDDVAGWSVTEIVSVSGSEVTISNSCGDGQFVSGVRYSWRVSPCTVLKQCPVYADTTGNNLPAPPFLYNGLVN